MKIDNISITVIPIIFLLFSCSSEKSFVNQVKNIHHNAITIDTHIDTPIHLNSDPSFDLSAYHNPGKKGSGKVDFPRMKKGGLDAAFFIVWTAQGELNPAGYKTVKTKALNIFNIIHKNINKFPRFVEAAYSTDDVYRIVKSEKIAILIGMENGYPIGRDLSSVEKYYKLGARYITLCHTKDNDICDSSTDESEDNGLSEFGEKVVEEMNRLGIMIDVSHISDKSFYDVIKISKTPVIASHSCCRALCNHPRNMTDDMIKMLAQKGGVIQLTLVNEYIKTPEPNPQRDSAIVELKKKLGDFSKLSPKELGELENAFSELSKKFPQTKATVQDFVNHVDHVVKLVGIDFVGIGSDFDGGGGIEGVNDVSEMENITMELIRRGYSEKGIKKIWGGNLLRVFAEVENYAKKLK